jgi:hypothetical protein
MPATAKNGIVALKAAWEVAEPAMRAYVMAKHRGEWDALKKTAVPQAVPA